MDNGHLMDIGNEEKRNMLKNDSENSNSQEMSKLRDHLANERTFLAWIRTCIGIMAFGFVVEKFAFFLKKLTYFLGKSQFTESNPVPHSVASLSPEAQGYTSFFGITLVALGALLCVLAFIKYKRVESQIEENRFDPSILLDIMLTLSVLLIGILLVLYLISSL